VPQRSIEGCSHLSTSNSSRKRWDKLFAKLVRIDRRKVAQIAPSLLGERGETETIPAIEDAELSKLWAALGGLTGLQALQKNSAILVEMALYWQEWYPDVLVTTERLRSDARQLNWHLSRLEAASRTKKLRVTIPFYVPRALSVYYRMTRDLLDLYQVSNSSMFASLRKVL
jgi:hypothetical protein